MAGHDVGVPLDHDDLAILGNRTLREIDPVEHLRLVIDARFGGVEVLRPLVVVAQTTGPKPDGRAGDVANRPDQAPTEAVINTAVTARNETGSLEFLFGELLRLEVLDECVVRIRSEANTEVVTRCAIEAATREEVLTESCFRRCEQFNEELFRRRVRLEDAGALRHVTFRSTVLVGQLETDLPSEFFDGFGERQVFQFL